MFDAVGINDDSNLISDGARIGVRSDVIIIAAA